ncbi:MAG: FAD-binding oxidoreductase [Pirellulales bacterium]
MKPTTVPYPCEETVTPDDQQSLGAYVRDAYHAETAIYPVGGGTSLAYGLPATRPGIALATERIDRVIDYPSRDMTLTVEAGIRIATLAQTVAAEGQCLPIDVPLPNRATLGGILATNTSGPRRYAMGTLRDYVIGIRAVDGRGIAFQAGGRVVKNVAGYDFCKLLIGSLGTIGVVTQVTLKLRPLPAASRLMLCQVDNPRQMESLLAAMVHSQTTPTAIEWIAGPHWLEGQAGLRTESETGCLVVGLEGTEVEIDWMIGQLASEWEAQGMANFVTLSEEQTAPAWTALTEFPSLDGAPLVVKISVLPSCLPRMVGLVQQLDPTVSILAHAGNGILLIRFSQFDASDVTRRLIGQLQPAAMEAAGSVVVLSSQLPDLTRQAIWGHRDASVSVMETVRTAFDPRGILNPGRFIYQQ